MISRYFCLLVLLTLAAPAWSATRFSHEFAPQEGLVTPPEHPWREELCLNGRWQFQPAALPVGYDAKSGPPALPLPTPSGWSKTPIRIPSPWNVNSFSAGPGGDFRCFPSYPASWEQAPMGWLRRRFRVPAAWHGQRLVLHFDAVAGDCQVFINGKPLAQHFDSFLPFEVDVTDAVRWGTDNELRLGVRKPDLFNVPGPLGSFSYPTGSFWGGHIVGVWQDVFLEALPPLHVEDVAIRPLVAPGVLEMAVTVRNQTGRAQPFALGGQVQPWVSKAGRAVVSAPEPRWALGPTALVLPAVKDTVAAGATKTVILRQSVHGRLALWTPETPRLYGAVLSLTQTLGIETPRYGQRKSAEAHRVGGPAGTFLVSVTVDRHYQRFGWRQWTVQGKHLLLNGRPVQLKGDAWHFMGVPEMTRRYAWAWFRMLKDAHANAVRLHAQPYPRFFLDVADEQGIAVLDESAIWASHCNFNYDAPEFWPRAQRHIHDLVLRDRDHPSVFGWSVSNEILPALGVKGGAGEVQARVTAQIVALAHQVQALDPTRPWVSSDGDRDMGGRLPAFVDHYGDAASWAQEAPADKPFGIGEASSAYYGTPTDEAKFNGDRAYQSMEGRMEALAIESYALIRGQRPLLAYCSVFNLVWYGLQPLELGLPDTRRPPTGADGIVFGPFVEGKPGMQPERLGPYSTTLNPGYDPRLPLYRPWPMWDAVKAAYAPGGPAPSPWDHRPAQRPLPLSPAATIGQVAFIGDRKGALNFLLETLGVPVTASDDGQTPRLLVVDGATLTVGEVPDARQRLQAVRRQGGTVLVWVTRPETLPLVNQLLPASVTLTDHDAASLLADRADPVTASFSLAELYFAENSSRTILTHGLAGPLVAGGRALMEACPTDWRRWNGQGENTKTASVLRSEREAQPSGAALVTDGAGPGRLLVTSLPSAAPSPQHQQLLRKLFANLGVGLGPLKSATVSGFDAAGYLHEALVAGSYAAPSYEQALDTDFLGGEAAAAPKAGDTAAGRTWHPVMAGGDGVFNLKAMGLPGPNVNCAAYLSFWLYSPRPLDQLLAAPDVPQVSLLATSDDGMMIWLNGKPLLQERGHHPVDVDHPQSAPLPLAQGWNHVLVKVGQADGEWGFAARLSSSDPRFLTELRSATERPAP